MESIKKEKGSERVKLGEKVDACLAFRADKCDTPQLGSDEWNDHKQHGGDKYDGQDPRATPNATQSG
jgi:hypothetical protein